jgi:CDP-diacylglycerol--glycerol-3-phosphate 3-phosphatidyltransferase
MSISSTDKEISPATPPTVAPSDVVVNVPNVISAIRFVLAIVVFALLPWQEYWTTTAALVVFVIAAGTDWIDGYYARRFNQVTKVGRMLDPFVDKVIICGTYIMLAAEQLAAGQWYGITGWMAVVVMGREMLVTALRSSIEQAGGDFSAKWSGKWKMVFQCIAVGAAMVCLMYHQSGGVVPPWLQWTMFGSAWVAVLITIYSGVEYIVAAAKFR